MGSIYGFETIALVLQFHFLYFATFPNHSYKKLLLAMSNPKKNTKNGW